MKFKAGCPVIIDGIHYGIIDKSLDSEMYSVRTVSNFNALMKMIGLDENVNDSDDMIFDDEAYIVVLHGSRLEPDLAAIEEQKLTEFLE